MKKAADIIGRGRLLYRLYLKEISFRQALHLFKSAALRPFSGIRYPLSVLIGLTDECQCVCTHCGVDRPHAGQLRQLLSLSEIHAILDELSRLGVVNVTFAGGEPILRKEIFEIIRAASRKGFFTSLDSNGLLLNRENLEKLKKAGLTLVKISLDSSRAETHDKNRGIEGCFEKALAAVKNCASLKIPAIVTTVVTGQVIKDRDLENIVRLVKSAGASALQVEFLAYSGRARNPEYAFLNEKMLEYVNGVCDYRYVYHSSIFSDLSKCSCLSRMNCYISAQGEVKICMFFPHVFGNIRENDFKSIWKGMSVHPLYKLSSKDCYSIHSRFAELADKKP